MDFAKETLNQMLFGKTTVGIKVSFERLRERGRGLLIADAPSPPPLRDSQHIMRLNVPLLFVWRRLFTGHTSTL